MKKKGKAEKYSVQEIILETLMQKKTQEKQGLIEKIVSILKKRGNQKERKTKEKYTVQRRLKKMLEDGLIVEYGTEFSRFVRITDDGEKRYYYTKLLSSGSILPREWDGLWRIIIVDIEKEDKDAQDAIRYILKKAYFVQVKASVWVSPFPLESVLKEMKKILGLENKIYMFNATSLDRETEEAVRSVFLKKI